MDAAIACEARIGEELDRVAARDNLSKTSTKKALSSNDFTMQLTKGVEGLTGRRFEDEVPGALPLLQSLRVARGNVAHGGPLLVPGADGKAREPEPPEIYEMLHAALKALNWLGGL